VQSTHPDPVLVGRLTSLVAQARTVVVGTHRPTWQQAVGFLTRDFPAVLYRARWWWISCAAAFLVGSFALAAYVAGHPAVQLRLTTPEQIKQLVNHDFADYYKQAPAQDFAAKVFTNNAFLAAATISTGVLLGLPVLYFLYGNAVNVGVVGGIMASHGHAAEFFGLILPHGMLELSAVFIASGLGLKLGWTAVDPGARPRALALAEEGRALLVGALGVALMVLVSGVIEAFVTPSPLPTWARIGIGLLAEAALMWVVFFLGRRAALADVTGDVDVDVLPYA
jgi:uncharacterized membrane protein SpoIIM required for sporulation